MRAERCAMMSSCVSNWHRSREPQIGYHWEMYCFSCRRRESFIVGLLPFTMLLCCRWWWWWWCNNQIKVREFRLQVLELLVRLYRSSLSFPNYTKIVSMLLNLADAEAIATVLMTLMKGSEVRIMTYILIFSLIICLHSNWHLKSLNRHLFHCWTRSSKPCLVRRHRLLIEREIAVRERNRL